MAIAPVQVGPNGCEFNPSVSVGGSGASPGTGPLSCTFSVNVTAGNTLQVNVHSRVSGATGITSITDSLSTPTVYTQRVGGTNSTTGVWMYTGVPTVSGAATVTVVLNGTYFFGWITMMEYPATVKQTVATTNGTVIAHGVTGAQSCGSFTPGEDATQIVMAIFNNQSNVPGETVNSPLTAQIIGSGGTNFRQAVLGDYFQATAAAITPGASNSNGTATSFSCAAIALQTVATSGARRRVIN